MCMIRIVMQCGGSMRRPHPYLLSVSQRFLERIELRPEETGYTQAQVRAAIEAMYGAPASEEQGRSSWADPVYSKYITLSTDEQGALVTVSNYSVGITNVLSSYQVKGGQVQIADPKDRAVWEYLCTILPLEARQKITQFNLFSDGYSNILAYTSPVEENGVTDNSRFCISIDYYDVYDENGARRDWSKLTIRFSTNMAMFFAGR